ncbi:MAG: methyltransferase domain-containing protein [Bacteroidetes bacterium]|nr:methyltransferase domain-containing protein [Bacteroidota bacterium]
MDPVAAQTTLADTETICCSFCQSKQSSVHVREGQWTIVRCSNCGFCYTNPRPTMASLPRYYEESYFNDERHRLKFYNPDGSIRMESGEGYHNRIEDVERRVSARGKVLELGCARGFFLQTLKDRGWEVEGVEISADAVAIGRNHLGLNIHQGTLEDFTGTGPYDVVCMYQTLEHVPDPHYVMKRSRELLRQGGVFVAEVPNLTSFDMLGNPERRRLSHDLPRHLNHFTPEVLVRELEREGFREVQLSRYYPQFLVSILQGRNVGKPAPPPAADPGSSTAGASVKAASTSAVARDKAALPPLAIPASGWKQQALNGISRIFPGWRMTVSGLKS